MCKEKHCESSSWLGNSAGLFVVHEHVNIHILRSLLWDCVDTAVCEKCLVHRGECVTTGGLYRPTHLCVAHFELHKKVSYSFFLWRGKVGWCLEGGGGWSMFQEVGDCMGFQRGAGWFEFRALTAWGKKLLSSLAERALMLWYRLPDGRSWKRLWEGWMGSFTMLLVLLEHRARNISRMDGRGAPMIFAAVFTVRCRVLRSAALQFLYQTVMQLVSTLSMVPL